MTTFLMAAGAMPSGPMSEEDAAWAADVGRPTEAE
jgi:hypothetical protein